MKTLAALVVFMCALTFLGSRASGQITITIADASKALTVGDSLANRIDTVASTLDVGKHGLTSWDFSSLRSDRSQTLTSVAVGGTPFAGSYPSATHAFIVYLNVAVGAGILPAVGYVYFQLGTNVLNLGESANVASGAATAYAFNNPADIFYSLPSTYGTSWTSTYLDTTSVFVGGGIFLQGSSARHHTSYVIDAYGPMTIPGGSVHDALRIKKTDSVANYSSGALTTSKSVSYIFLARDFASVQATALDLTQPDSGTIQIVLKSASWNGQVVALPIQLAAFNASPNPVGGGVLLRWRTLSEVNNYGFDVERGSSVAGEFVPLPGAFIPGHGTTTVPCDYTYTDGSAVPGTWYYRLRQIDLDGSVHYTDPAGIDVKNTRPAGEVPAVFSLGQNFPNPFNPETTIRYGLPAGSHVELSVYNLLGERVALLVDGVQDAGFHDVRFDASRLASGIYFYRLQAPGFVQARKLSLLR